MGKALAMAIIIIGVIAATIGEAWDVEPMRYLVSILREVFSTN